MRKNLLKIVPILIGMLLFLGSCTKYDITERLISDNSNQVNENILPKTKELYFEEFSKALSKAYYNNLDIRLFIKTQLLRRIDNDFNIFYPEVKDKKINGASFESLLKNYSDNPKIFDNILEIIPLLNIHFPQIADIKISKLNSQDNNVPILYGSKLYLNGNVIREMAADELPIGNLLVICESSSIVLNNNTTRSSVNVCSFNPSYSFISEKFNSDYKTRGDYVRYYYDSDNLSEREEKGNVKEEEIDPLVIKAFKNCPKDSLSNMRYYLYYNTDNILKPNKFRNDINEYIYAIRLNQEVLLKVTEMEQFNKLFTEIYKINGNPVSRDNYMSHLLENKVITLNVKILDNKKETEEITIYPRFDELFNLKVEHRRWHRTWFSSGVSIYRITSDNVGSKWYFPMDKEKVIRFSSWDLSSNSYTKSIKFTFVNPKEGGNMTIKESVTTSNAKSWEINGSVSIDIKKIKAILGGKYDDSNTEKKTVEHILTYPMKSVCLSAFSIDYFKNYPIRMEYGDLYHLNRFGNGEVEIQILPMSDQFYYNRKYKLN